MAHDAVLESLICGIGYEMTPSEEELENQRRHLKKQQQQQLLNKPESMSGTMRPFQARNHRSGEGGGDGGAEEPEGRAMRRSSKLRRAFSLNSYPFLRAKSSSSAQNATMATGEVEGGPTPPPADNTAGGHEAKRRVSWRKFLLKIAAQFGGGSNLIVSQCALGRQ